MNKIVLSMAFAILTIATTAFAGNVHRDASGTELQVFAPARGVTVTQTKADATYTPTRGTRVIRFQPSANVTYKINGTGAAYPVAANANEGPFGIATKGGVGVAVTSIVFGGASSATKTIYVQEQ